jgi:hypothetical protein
VLQKEFRPVGGKREVFSDFRLIAASDSSLGGQFGGNVQGRSCSGCDPTMSASTESVEDIEDWQPLR